MQPTANAAADSQRWAVTRNTSAMTLETAHLVLTPYPPKHLLALLEDAECFEECFGLPAASLPSEKALLGFSGAWAADFFTAPYGRGSDASRI